MYFFTAEKKNREILKNDIFGASYPTPWNIFAKVENK